jgi:hypothetical protein
MSKTSKPKSKARSNNDAWKNASDIIGKTIATTLSGINKEVASRAYRTSNELRNASLHVLRGQRSGRRYKIPHTKKYYTASDGGKGESPAVRTGIFRLSWGIRVHVEKSGNKFKAVSAIESNVKVGKYLLGEILEEGTERMAARPYKQKVRDRTMPKIQAIYNKPYKI